MKQAGIHDIAELAKVSIGTVDRALHGRPGISKTTRKRVLAIAKRLAYMPHPAARTLSVGHAGIRIGVCIPEEIRFFYDQVRAGIFDEASRVKGLGLEIVYKPVPSLGKGEQEHIADLLAVGIGALIVTPGNPKLVTPLIDKAEKQKVRVICITTDAPRSRRTSFVGVDPELSGKMAAELMAKFVPDSAKAAIVTGMLAAEEHRLKALGFRSGFTRDCRNGKIVTVVEGHESEEESYRKTSRLIAAHPDLQGIYVSTVNCLPVCRALVDHGLAGRIRMITTDLFPEMAPYLSDGTIRASIYQDPYLQGQTAVRLLTDLLLSGTKIPKTNYLSPGIVLRTNLKSFRELAEKL